MQPSPQRNKAHVRALTEGAMLVALGFVLSWFRYSFAYGGSITPASMLPVIVIGLRWGPKWGIGSALVYSLLQMLQGFYPPPIAIQDTLGTVTSFALVVALDYVIAFTMLGLSGLFRNRKNGVLIAVSVCLVLRFVCHFVSGIIIWGEYSWEGYSVWLYSFCYNGIFMGAEMVLCLAAALMLNRKAPMVFRQQLRVES